MIYRLRKKFIGIVTLTVDNAYSEVGNTELSDYLIASIGLIKQEPPAAALASGCLLPKQS